MRYKCRPGVIAVQENLRQLCVFKLANESGKPWFWWDYVTRFGDECSMVDRTYDEDCAEKARTGTPSLGVLLLRLSPIGASSLSLVGQAPGLSPACSSNLLSKHCRIRV